MDDMDQIDFLEEDVERIDGTVSALKVLCAYLLAERAILEDAPDAFIASFSNFSFTSANRLDDASWVEGAEKTMLDIQNHVRALLSAKRTLN